MKYIVLLALALPIGAEEMAELPFDYLDKMASAFDHSYRLTLKPKDPNDRNPVTLTLIDGQGGSTPLKSDTNGAVVLPKADKFRGKNYRIQADRPKGAMTMEFIGFIHPDMFTIIAKDGLVDAAQLRPVLKKAKAVFDSLNEKKMDSKPESMGFFLQSSNYKEFNADLKIGSAISKLQATEGTLYVIMDVKDLESEISIQCDKKDIDFSRPKPESP